MTTVVGYSMLSQVTNTYSAFFFITLENWAERKKPEEQYAAIKAELTKKLGGISSAIAFAFPPPAIQGVGTSGGATFILQDRAGKEVAFLAENTTKFIEAARKRPELASVSTTFRPNVPQLFVEVDQDKVLKQGVALSDVYKTLQSFLGSGFINYFNRFGRQWQVYVQAEGDYRTNIDNVGQFYVRNSKGEAVPLSALTSVRNVSGPEFTMRYNLYRSAQINASAAPGFSSAQVMRALEEVFAETMPQRNGLRLHGHVVPGAEGAAGYFAGSHLRLLAALRLPDPGGAVRKLVAALLACCSARRSPLPAPSSRCCCAARRTTSMRRSAW